MVIAGEAELVAKRNARFKFVKCSYINFIQQTNLPILSNLEVILKQSSFFSH